MKKLFTLSALLMLLTSAVMAQQPIYKQRVFDDAYRDTILKAKELYYSKQYQKATDKYIQAFAHSGGKAMISDKYDAACCAAMSGNTDTAIEYLRVIAGGRYNDYNQMIIDPELEALHNHPKWNEICKTVRANRLIGQTLINIPLMEQLDTILQDDQKPRQLLESTENKYGRDSKEVRELFKTMGKYDTLNVKKVVAILDKYGWVGSDVVGGEGNKTLFLVIQHAETDVQVKYLPMMREAVKKGNARGSSLALLEDRVALAQGKKQIYGSQLSRTPDGPYMLDDLEDPINVDKRRAEVGLPPLADYLMRWNIKWDVNEYIKQQAAKK